MQTKMETVTGNLRTVARILTPLANRFYIAHTLFPLLFYSSLLILLTEIVQISLIHLLICLFKALYLGLFLGPISKLNIKYSASTLLWFRKHRLKHRRVWHWIYRYKLQLQQCLLYLQLGSLMIRQYQCNWKMGQIALWYKELEWNKIRLKEYGLFISPQCWNKAKSVCRLKLMLSI